MTDSDLERACRLIMGNGLAESIIADMGLHWCVAAAVAQAKTTDSPEGLRILKQHIAELRSARLARAEVAPQTRKAG